MHNNYVVMAVIRSTQKQHKTFAKLLIRTAKDHKIIVNKNLVN